ncbi:MAG: methyltransferase [Pseudomonadota bacterium]
MMRDPIFFATAIFVLAILGISSGAESFALAIYALSFWHYLVYALAFLWRDISHERFIRDSHLLKIIPLAALAAVLWTTVPSVLSAIAMAAGFGLNIAAAQALGKERTYYGYELAAIPAKHITSFPYSLTAHPMLIGNMLAFGGTLLDGDFLRDWWPLGIAHVVLNLAIILMEAYGGRNRRLGWIVAISGLALLAAALLLGFAAIWPYALATAAVVLMFGAVIIHRYSVPARDGVDLPETRS